MTREKINKKYLINCAVIAVALAGIFLVFPSCNRANAQPGDFEYREIYLPDPEGEDSKSLGLNNIDRDWGIWGHNLKNVLPAKHSETVYATIDGQTEYEQFCFSSNHLFKYICDYIDDNYGNFETKRFAILPNDNDLVCVCEECSALGNTRQNANPAVLFLIGRLAEKYPKHDFFTSHYITTSSVPADTLPANVGVLISAMEYPLSPIETPEESKFKNLIDEWSQKSKKVYIWDYINNFDDYFTPFPILGTMDRRLDLYRNAGVAGVFLNGSGQDYSVFSDIKKTVLSEMLKETDTDWKEKVKEVSKKYYPETGDLIAEYILAQEDYVASNGASLPMYEGIEVITKTYLNEQDFINFYDALASKSGSLSGKEKKAVDKALAAMSFTRLELMRKSGNTAGAEKYIKKLESLLPDVEIYNEACWSIANYVKDYKYMLRHKDTFSRDNLLKGVTLIPRSPLDDEYSDITVITDGLLGIPSNYHSGLLLSSAENGLTIEVPRQEGMNKVKAWFVKNKGYHIDLPEEVILKIGDNKYGSAIPPQPEHRSGHSSVEFDIPASAEGKIQLVIMKDPEVKTMAIDEIEAFRVF